MSFVDILFQEVSGTGKLSLAAITLRILISLGIGGIIGTERGIRNRPAGFMTYVLVSVGATIFMLTNQYMHILAPETDSTRFGAQVISGIGFLGAGTIIVTRQNEIRGLTTAAGLWVAAALGLAAGAGFYEGAVMGTLFSVFALVVLKKIDVYIKQHSRIMEIYIEYNSFFSLRNLSRYIEKQGFDMYDMQRGKVKMLDKEMGTLTFSLDLFCQRKHQEILDKFYELEGVEYVKEIA